MTFIETPVFTKAIDELLDADDYGALQAALLVRPKVSVTRMAKLAVDALVDLPVMSPFWDS